MSTHKKHLLLISVSAGAGHVRAAEAIKKTALVTHPDAHVTHIDMMEYVTKTMRRLIVGSYDLMVKQLPELWGFIYKTTNQTVQRERYEELTALVNRMNATKFYQKVIELNPDAILCTHYLPVSALLKAPAKYDIKAPLSLLMTDYDKHALVMQPGLSTYFVSNDKIRWKMTHAGIPPHKIILSGIPIDPVFYMDKSREGLHRLYHLPAERKTILVLSGGHGMKRIDEIVTTLTTLGEPLSIIAIAGKNEKLLARLERLPVPNHIHFVPVGWTDTMDEYMRLADIIISKPGGLTTSECLVLGKPLIAIDPIPGQEEANAEYITWTGTGVVARSAEDILYYISTPLSLWYQPTRLPALSPRAADVILGTLLAS